MKRVLFISSSGGHLEQLLCLKETMEKFDSFIVTEKNKTTENLKKKYKNIAYLPFFSRQNKRTFPFVFIGVFFKSIYLFFKTNPQVIVSTGAGGVIPMLLIGKLFGRKLIFIETFSRTDSKTLTGKICYLFADSFIVQWEGLLSLYPKAKYFGSIY
ncbi:MAG TPA: PssD/Cps14F family polysaccharide biosynthesis glycosyltransferase [Flavobacteriaceae bacterium]|nr:PssD/Cps14F family polysaccharide biosynthesis glycosyltransferase [Flavobacteriaceae bacterium]